MKTAEKTKIEMDEILDMIEKPILEYVQQLMEKCGVKIDKNGAENIISNVGLHILQKKKILSTN